MRKRQLDIWGPAFAEGITSAVRDSAKQAPRSRRPYRNTDYSKESQLEENHCITAKANSQISNGLPLGMAVNNHFGRNTPSLTVTPLQHSLLDICVSSVCCAPHAITVALTSMPLAPKHPVSIEADQTSAPLSNSNLSNGTVVQRPGVHDLHVAELC